MKPRRVILTRHAEAWKNVEGRHGGSGSALTELGRRQCQLLASQIRSLVAGLPPGPLIGHDAPQVLETVDLLQQSLKFTAVIDSRIRGMDLGVAAGRTQSELEETWPDVAVRLERWRRGELPIHQLDLPQAEPLASFKQRVETMLQEWVEQETEHPVVAVCTTSTLIMLVNLATLGSAFSWEGYRVHNFANASITQLEIHKGNAKVLSVNEVRHLCDKQTG